MNKIGDHRRVNDILLGPLERPALKWLAAHMPAWVTSDTCTIIGVFGAVLIMLSYALSRVNHNFLWLASFGFIVNWFGDSLDGTLARHRHAERPIFGFFVDHVTDAFNEVIIFLGMGLTPYIRFDLACLTLIAYLLLSVLVFLRTYVVGEFKISYGKLGPTEIRLLAILLNSGMYFGGIKVISLELGTPVSFTFSPYDLILSFITFLLLFFFVITAIQEATRLAKAGK